MMIDESAIVQRLQRWAKIKLQTGVKLGYPSESSFRRLTPAGTVSYIDQGVELEFAQTEDAFRLLPEIPQLVIRKEFLSTCRDEAAKAHQLGIAIRTFRQYKHNAYHLLANILNIDLTDDAGKVYKSGNL